MNSELAAAELGWCEAKVLDVVPKTEEVTDKRGWRETKKVGVTSAQVCCRNVGGTLLTVTLDHFVKAKCLPYVTSVGYLTKRYRELGQRSR